MLASSQLSCRFFKDRHWTTREFEELLENNPSLSERSLLEVGCGVGNLFYPLFEEIKNLKVYACDFSKRAIDFVKSNPLYDEERVVVFVADLTAVSYIICSENISLVVGRDGRNSFFI